jgi:ABC-type transport system substrate-binding protein
MRDLNQKLKRWGLGILAGSILLSSSVSSFAQSPADPKKVLRYVFPVAETGFDPAGVHDLYSAHVNGSIFETLFTYDYLASPAKLVPRTAAALPEVSADGLTYTIRLQKGIYFAADPVFKGKKRELTSADYVYTFKRLLDPSLHSDKCSVQRVMKLSLSTTSQAPRCSLIFLSTTQHKATTQILTR